MGIEKISQPDFGEQKREHLAPFERQQEKFDHIIELKEKIQALIDFMDSGEWARLSSFEKFGVQATIDSFKKEIEDLGGVDVEFQKLLAAAEEKFNEKRVESAKATSKTMGEISKFYDPRNQKRKKYH